MYSLLKCQIGGGSLHQDLSFASQYNAEYCGHDGIRDGLIGPDASDTLCVPLKVIWSKQIVDAATCRRLVAFECVDPEVVGQTHKVLPRLIVHEIPVGDYVSETAVRYLPVSILGLQRHHIVNQLAKRASVRSQSS
jgi:hypothetical protein